MKITKSRLRRIIQEELSNVLSENPFDSWDDAEDYDRDQNPQAYGGVWSGGAEAGDIGGPSMGGGLDFSSGLDPENLQSVDPEMQNPFYDQNVEGEYQQFLDDKEKARHAGVDQRFRRALNAMKKAGEIDQATWRAARRALYKPNGVRKAKSIVKNARHAADPGFAGGYADLASNPAAAAYED